MHLQLQATQGLDQPEAETILTYEVSDEALEAAAGSKEVGNYTLACTYFYFCPI